MTGSKAANLSRLLELGFSVPPFYTIESSVLQRLNADENDARLLKEFAAWKHAHNVKTVAVRSSAEGEDSAEQSFAGQFTSVMPVATEEEFLNALRVVSASQASKAYSTTEVPINVIVQQFILADAAGVCFTVDPVSGDSDVVINAAHGHGAQVVDGGEAATYRVQRYNKQLLQKVEPTSQVDVLTTQQCQTLATTALRIEKDFGSPQDIEWAMQNGSLFVLQTRPITRIGHLGVWDSSNISESFPGTVSPLTFSIAQRGYFLAYSSQAHASGLKWEELQRQQSILDSMLSVFDGKVYYNLSSWYRFIALFPGSAKNQKYLDEQIQTSGKAAYVAGANHSIFWRARFWTRTISRILRFKHNQRLFRELFDDRFRHLSEMPPGPDAYFLFERYQYLNQELMPYMGRSVDNDIFVMLCNGWMNKVLRRWLPNVEHANRIVLGDIRDVVSADQARMLYEITAQIRLLPDVARAFTIADTDATRLAIRGTRVSALIDSYRSTFGHRFAEDQKIESHNALLDDSELFLLIRSYLKIDLDEIAKRSAAATSSANNEVKAIERSLSLPKRAIFHLLHRRLKHHLRIREHNRLLRSKIFSECRAVFRDLGQTFVDDGVLLEPKDIYQLRVDEIDGFLNAKLPDKNLRDVVEHRKTLLQAPAQSHERFTTTRYPYVEVDSLQLPSEQPLQTSGSLTGTISSPGDVTGKATVLLEPTIPSEPFEILVVSHTDPGWTPLIALAKGVVVEHGGLLSHAAIITRELGIPSIIGVDGATTVIRSGSRIALNTAMSSVDLLDD